MGERLRLRSDRDRLTHYLFRYPAKFHPPVQALLQRYTCEGDVVLDPFCGSGTLLLEASVSGRPSIGIDIDPVAVEVARAKVRRYDIPRLRQSAELILSTMERYRRPDREYRRRMFQDLARKAYASQLRRLRKWIPEIPNLLHWFRKYVVLDLVCHDSPPHGALTAGRREPRLFCAGRFFPRATSR